MLPNSNSARALNTRVRKNCDFRLKSLFISETVQVHDLIDLCTSAPVEHRPQTTFLHLVLSSAVISIFLQLYLNPAETISDSISLLQVFLSRPLLLCTGGVHWRANLAMLLSFLCSVCPRQLHFLLLICFTIGC